MKYKVCLIIIFFITTHCCAQEGWQLEIMPGIAAYQGDLTQQSLPFKTIGPAGTVNIKYNTNDMIVVRAGIAWGKLAADDKNNRQADIRARNLNFKTDIFEASVCAEVNVLDPEDYTSWPYMFLGAGIFHFNPYTYDKNNRKTYLQPLSTEGEGLVEYPNRKTYSLTQFCIPVGGGYNWKLNSRYKLSIEIGVRFLFTDYLDDVSKTYINPETLLLRKGQTAYELAFRQAPEPKEGDQRGNSKTKDMYGFSGVKLTYNLGKAKK